MKQEMMQAMQHQQEVLIEIENLVLTLPEPATDITATYHDLINLIELAEDNNTQADSDDSSDGSPRFSAIIQEIHSLVNRLSDDTHFAVHNYLMLRLNGFIEMYNQHIFSRCPTPEVDTYHSDEEIIFR